MSHAPGSPSQADVRRDALRGLALLVAVVVGLAVLFFDWGGDETADARATAEASPSSSVPSPSAAPSTTAATTAEPSRNAERPRVPDVSGLQLDVAEQRLYDFEEVVGVDAEYPQSHDLSPRDRSQWDDSNWTVVTTRPAAGAAMVEGMDLHLFVLRNAEYAWFAAHRYAAGYEPYYASRPYSSPRRPIEGLIDDPSIQPVSEQQERDALAQAYEYGTLTVSSLPSPDSPLRVGRLLTITVREEPVEPAPPVTTDDSSVDVYPDYSGGDDDVDVPGWLCPTRFC
jgi:hypothetical protein